jgi:hypothetical protein
MDVVDAMPVAVRRRSHAALPRHRQVVLRFSEEERAAVGAAARADGLALGAWLGDLAVRAASAAVGPSAWELGMSRAEVLGALVRVRLDVSLALRILQINDDLDPVCAPGAAVDAAEAEVVRLNRAALTRLDSLIDRTVEDDATSEGNDPM